MIDDVVEGAVEAVRETHVPGGPPPSLYSTLLRAGNDLDPATISHLAYEGKATVRRTTQAGALAIAVAAVVGLASVLFFNQGRNVVLADVVKQIQNAKSATWTSIFVLRAWNQDKSKTWLETKQTRFYYQAPGRRRAERLDEHGQVESVEIDDSAAGRRVEFWMNDRHARTINRPPLPPAEQKAISDPLSRLRAKLKGDSTALGKKRVGGREVIGFRILQDKSRPDSSADLWIDAQSGRLVYVLVGAHELDPETDAIRDNPPDKAYFREAAGFIMRDIAFDVKLDDSLFRLEPPKSFSNDVRTKHEPTEKDVMEWFGVLAQAHGGVFPPEIKESNAKLNEFLRKSDRDRTPAETKLIRQQSWADQGLVYPYPIVRFVAQLPRGDWHYQGSGVKLGNRAKAIFWYCPKGSKTFRAIYGDLSVREIAAADLPPAK